MKNEFAARTSLLYYQLCRINPSKFWVDMLDVDYVLDLLSQFSHKTRRSRQISIHGYSVSLYTKTLQVFKTRGTRCILCGLQGKIFAIERNDLPPMEQPYYLALYGFRDGREVLFTRDHVIPQAKGGRCLHYNAVPMCHDCNNKKGDKLTLEQWEHIYDHLHSANLPGYSYYRG